MADSMMIFMGACVLLREGVGMSHRQLSMGEHPKRSENPIISTHSQGAMPNFVRVSRRLIKPAILLGCLLVILSPILFYGRTLVPITTAGVLPSGAYGYSGPTPELPTTRDPVGTVGTDYAEWAYIDRALSAGELPFWNPNQGLGRPLLAEQWAGVFFPVSLLRHVLPSAYWDLVGVANLLLASIFLAMLGRVMGLGASAALFAGVGAFASGFFHVYLSVITIMAPSAWVPLLLFGVEWAHRKPQSRLRGLPVLVATYALGTAGHGTPAIFAVVFLALYVVARSWQEPRTLRTLLSLLPYFVGGALLAAPQWLPFVQYMVASHDDLLAQHGGAYAFYRLWHLPALVFPYLYGPLNISHPFGIAALNLGEYWGLGWLPAAVMFPALVGIVRIARQGQPAPRAMLVAVGIMTLWAINIPPFSLLSNVPVLWRLNFNYFWLLLHVVLLVHAGLGLAYLARADGRAWGRAIAAWVAFCGLILLIAFGYVVYGVTRPGSSLAGVSRAYLPPGLGIGIAWAVAVPLCLRGIRLMAPATRIPFYAIAICGVVLSAIGYFPYATKASVEIARWGSIAAYLAIVAVHMAALRLGRHRQRWAWALVPVAGLFLTYVATVPRQGLLPRLDPLQAAPYVKVLQDRAGSDRVYGIGGYLTSNFSGAFGLAAVNILTPMVPREPLRFMHLYLDQHQLAGAFFGSSQWGRVVPSDPIGQLQSSRRLWDYLGVRYIVLDGDLDERLVVAPLDLFSAQPPPGAHPAPLLPISPHTPVWVDKIVDCNDGAFHSVDVLLSTYARTNPGQVVLQVLTPQGALFTQAEADASQLVDNAYQNFTLPRAVCSDRRGSMLLRLHYRGSDRNLAIAYWVPEKHGGFVYRRLGLAPVKFGGGAPYDFQPVQLPASVQFRTRCPGRPVSAMELRLSTYMRVNPGRVAVTLRADDGGGRVLGRSVINSASVVDNGMARFTFATPVCNASEQDLLAELTHEGAVPGRSLAYWRSASSNGVEHALITMRDLKFAPIYEDKQAGARIWENLQAQPRVYLAPEFIQGPKWEEAMQTFHDQEDLRRAAVGERGWPMCPSNPAYPKGEPVATVHRIAIGPNTVDTELDARTSGTLVVADNYAPGWQATVNGREQPVLRVNGTFRGVCIPEPGHYKVSWRYRPPLWNSSLWMAALGGLIVAAALTWSLVRRSQVRESPLDC
jgi:hypothetical protein